LLDLLLQEIIREEECRHTASPKFATIMIVT